jgi:hypothetical protein
MLKQRKHSGIDFLNILESFQEENSYEPIPLFLLFSDVLESATMLYTACLYNVSTILNSHDNSILFTFI